MARKEGRGSRPTRILRKSAAFLAALGVAASGHLVNAPAAHADALSDAKAELASAQAELNTANANFTSVKNAKAKVDTVNSQAASANGVTNDVSFTGQTPIYVQVNGSTAKPASTTLVAVEGQFVTSGGGYNQTSILNYINQVRKEAYQAGYTTKYVPLTWSKGLERAAQIRAVEVSIYGDHTRPSGEKWHGLGDEGIAQAYGENLSWGADYFGNVKMWVDEKADYIKERAGQAHGETGHYKNLINMNFTQIGIAQFNTNRSTVNPYGNAMAAEFSYNVASTGSTDVKAAGQNIYQGVFVQNASIAAIGAAGATTFKPAAVSGDPVFYRNSTVNEVKALAKAEATTEWNRISADYNAKQAAVNTANSKVAAAQAKVNAASGTTNTSNNSSANNGTAANNGTKNTGSTANTSTGTKNTGSTANTSTGTKNTVKTQNMYRMYNRISHEHLYTASTAERDALAKGDWTYEGVGWVAPVTSNTPVYRLYNPGLGDHHYTTDKNEVKVLTSSFGWKSEGIGWYSSDQKQVKVYRQFHSALRVGSHNYTTDENEYKVNNRNGWAGEGVAWYAVQKGWSK